jgi:hypothetical protein
MFCSDAHRQHYNKGKTWEGYFKRLLHNNAKNRTRLSIKFLTNLLAKQKGKCALSGVDLTKIAGEGVVTTNASIDRINPGRAYTRKNVRLLCNFVNSFRGNVTDAELKWWSSRIVDNG